MPYDNHPPVRAFILGISYPSSYSIIVTPSVRAFPIWQFMYYNYFEQTHSPSRLFVGRIRRG